MSTECLGRADGPDAIAAWATVRRCAWFLETANRVASLRGTGRVFPSLKPTDVGATSEKGLPKVAVPAVSIGAGSGLFFIAKVGFFAYAHQTCPTGPGFANGFLIRVNRIKFLWRCVPFASSKRMTTICNLSQDVAVQSFTGRQRAFATWHDPCISRVRDAKVHVP